MQGVKDNAPKPPVTMRPLLPELVRNAMADAQLEGFMPTPQERERVRAALQRLLHGPAPNPRDR